LTTEPAPASDPSALLQRYHALLDVSDVIHACRDLDELFRKLAGLLHSMVPFDSIAVAMLQPDKKTVRLDLVESWVRLPVEVGFTITLEGIPAKWVIENQRPLRVLTAANDPRFHLHTEKMREAGFAVSFHLPLTTSHSRLGEIIFCFREEVEVPESELQFMQRAADQVAVAIENAGNFDQAHRAQAQSDHLNRQRQQLLDLTNRMVTQLDLQDVLRAAVSSVRRIVSCALAAVALPEPDGENLVVVAMEFPGGKGLLREGMKLPMDGSNVGRAFTTGQPVIMNTPDPSKYSPDVYRRVTEEGVKAQCFVPMLSRGKCVGVLGMSRTEEGLFSDDEMQFLTHVAGQIAIAVENAQQYEQIREAEREVARERDRSQLLLEVNNAVVAHLEIKELVKSVSASLRKVVNHDAAAITLLDAEGGVLRIQGIDLRNLGNKGPFEEGFEVSLDGTPEGEAIATRRPVLVTTVDFQRFPSPVVRVGFEQGIRSGCAVPLMSRERPLGALSVVSRREHAFTEEHARLLEQCAGQIAIAAENALAYKQITELKDKLAQEKLYLEDEIRTERHFDEIVGESFALRKVLQQIQTVAASDSTVLILGETGTGKELIARAIHESSRRNGRTFVKLNCAAIPTGLLESELFGHERGAFTGAIAQRIGRMELANGGTLFLDEVGDIPLELQPKLLRALQEREFERLGSVRTQKSDVRFLAATNRDLGKMVAEKQFRSDLFYRLNVFPVSVPALRERREDIPRLVRYFVSKYSKKMDKRIETIPTVAMAKLQTWPWPGNVRELENFIERSVILTNGHALHVPMAELESAAASQPATALDTLQNTERDHILRILRETRGVLAGPAGAAARLGVKRTTLQYKMKKLGINRDSY